jgi:hypothetical protein
MPAFFAADVMLASALMHMKRMHVPVDFPVLDPMGFEVAETGLVIEHEANTTE